MTNLFTGAIALLAGISASAQGGAELEQHGRYSRLDGSLQRLFEQLNVPGMATGIVRGGELAWFKGYGHADIENQVPVTKDTPYHLASLTKTFASTMMLSLVQEGQVELDMSVSDFGVDLGSSDITVRHLFSHTSEGIPGEHYAYNGNRFGFLDRVMEAVTGMGFMPHFEELFTDRLQLKNTGGMQGPLETPLARPYRLNGEGKLELFEYRTYLGSSAGIVSSVADYARYIAAIEEREYLTSETQALAFAPTISNGGDSLPYGLGWFTEEFEGTRLIWHYGHWDCTSTLVLMLPEQNVTFLAFTNTDHLSRGFPLGTGSVLVSPVAQLFLEAFVFDENHDFEWPAIDWRARPETIAKSIASIESPARERLAYQLLGTELAVQRTAGDVEGTRHMRSVYQELVPCAPLEALRGMTVLARLHEVGPNQDVTRDFDLDQPATIHIVCAGEISQRARRDYGSIENRETGAVVWQLRVENSAHAGGHADNQIAAETLELPAGMYRIRYRSDGGHDFESWNRAAPDGLFWGIVIAR